MRPETIIIMPREAGGYSFGKTYLLVILGTHKKKLLEIASCAYDLAVPFTPYKFRSEK